MGGYNTNLSGAQDKSKRLVLFFVKAFAKAVHDRKVMVGNHVKVILFYGSAYELCHFWELIILCEINESRLGWGIQTLRF